MAIQMNTIVAGSLGLAVLFILLTNIIAPFWNSSALVNVGGTGLSQTAWQGLIQIVGVIFIVGMALLVYKGSNKS